jgi:hypothetical protein
MSNPAGFRQHVKNCELSFRFHAAATSAELVRILVRGRSHFIEKAFTMNGLVWFTARETGAANVLFGGVRQVRMPFPCHHAPE